MPRKWVGVNHRNGLVCDGFNVMDNVSMRDEEVLRTRPAQLPLSSFTDHGAPISGSGIYFQSWILWQVPSYKWCGVRSDGAAAWVDTSLGLTSSVNGAAVLGGRLYIASANEMRCIPTADDPSSARSVGLAAPPTYGLQFSSGTLLFGIEGRILIRYRYVDTSANTLRLSNPSPAKGVTYKRAAGYVLTDGSGVPIKVVLTDPGGGYRTSTGFNTSPIGTGSGCTCVTRSDDTATGKITAITINTPGSGYAANSQIPLQFSLPDGALLMTGLALVAGVKEQVECTAPNGSSFYVYNTDVGGGGGAYTINDLSVATVTAKTPTSVNGDFGHAPPPTGITKMVSHRGRIFYYIETSKLLGWSRAGYPESFDVTTYSRILNDVNSDTGASVTALVSFLGDLYVFTRTSVYRYSYVDDPAFGTLIPIPCQFGAFGPKAVVQIDNRLFGVGPTGAWEITAISPMRISWNVDVDLKAASAATLDAHVYAMYCDDDTSINYVYSKTQPIAWSFQLRNREWGSWSGLLDGEIVQGPTQPFIITNTGVYKLETSSASEFSQPIEWVIESDWWALAKMPARVTPQKLCIEYEPNAAGPSAYIDVVQYRDLVLNPLVVTATSRDKAPDGVTLTAGAQYIRVDPSKTDGYVPVPVFADKVRTAKWRLEGRNWCGIQDVYWINANMASKMPGSGE